VSYIKITNHPKKHPSYDTTFAKSGAECVYL